MDRFRIFGRPEPVARGAFWLRHIIPTFVDLDSSGVVADLERVMHAFEPTNVFAMGAMSHCRKQVADASYQANRAQDTKEKAYLRCRAVHIRGHRGCRRKGPLVCCRARERDASGN